MDRGTTSDRVDPPQPEPTPPDCPPGVGSALPNSGNYPSEDSKPTRVLSNHKLRELRKKEKKAKELREKLEVHHGPHPFQRHVVLILLQREEKEKELERERAEREALELEEVCCDPDFFQEKDVLTIAGGEAAEGTQTRGEGG